MAVSIKEKALEAYESAKHEEEERKLHKARMERLERAQALSQKLKEVSGISVHCSSDQVVLDGITFTVERGISSMPGQPKNWHLGVVIPNKYGSTCTRISDLRELGELIRKYEEGLPGALYWNKEESDEWAGGKQEETK